MRYCPVVLSPNGRVKPDLVLVNRKQGRHPEGAYYLEWREKGRRVRLSVGKDRQEAAARRQSEQAELNALNNGVSVLPDNGKDRPRSIARAVAQFLEETELTKKREDIGCLCDRSELLRRILSQTLPARHRAQGFAQILCLPPG